MIERFTGKHRWLSNFWPCRVALDGVDYPTAEHAFQAAKTLDETERNRIRLASTPAFAKELGRKVQLRPGWERMKERVMLEVLRDKFRSVDLRRRLLATGTHILVEGNHHGDRYWGKVNGEGENRLGYLLMHLRSELTGKP